MGDQIPARSRPSGVANEILNRTAKSIEKKYNLKTMGTGTAMPGGIIKELVLAFGTKDTLSKSQLRFLLIQIANELLNQVNSNNNIQKFLEKSPFTIENVQIIIYNRDKHGSEVYSPEISTADISEGVFSYHTVNQNDTFVYDNPLQKLTKKR